MTTLIDTWVTVISALRKYLLTSDTTRLMVWWMM